MYILYLTVNTDIVQSLDDISANEGSCSMSMSTLFSGLWVRLICQWVRLIIAHTLTNHLAYAFNTTSAESYPKKAVAQMTFTIWEATGISETAQPRLSADSTSTGRTSDRLSSAKGFSSLNKVSLSEFRIDNHRITSVDIISSIL